MTNNSPFGLAAAVRTKVGAQAHRVAAAIKCGIVWINDRHGPDPAPPWGGVKLSGTDHELGRESLDARFDVKIDMVDRSLDQHRDAISHL